LADSQQKLANILPSGTWAQKNIWCLRDLVAKKYRTRNQRPETKKLAEAIMSSKKEQKTAYFIAVILLAIGIICFSAFPAKAPETPVRIMFKSLAGKVFFDHKTHVSEKGYALSCGDCHHHPE